jgi:hypothetical protein
MRYRSGLRLSHRERTGWQSSGRAEVSASPRAPKAHAPARGAPAGTSRHCLPRGTPGPRGPVVRSQPTSTGPSARTAPPALVRLRRRPPRRRQHRLRRPPQRRPPRLRLCPSTRRRRRSAAMRLTATHLLHQMGLGRTAPRPTPTSGRTAAPWDSFAATSPVLRGAAIRSPRATWATPCAFRSRPAIRLAPPPPHQRRPR